jgi:hypothetical protein
MLTPEDNEDTSQERDDSWNDTKVESKNSNQADEDEIDRQQQHSDVFSKGHEVSMEQGPRSVESEPPRSGCFPAADLTQTAVWRPPLLAIRSLSRVRFRKGGIRPQRGGLFPDYA